MMHGLEDMWARYMWSRRIALLPCPSYDDLPKTYLLAYRYANAVERVQKV